MDQDGNYVGGVPTVSQVPPSLTDEKIQWFKREIEERQREVEAMKKRMMSEGGRWKSAQKSPEALVSQLATPQTMF